MPIALITGGSRGLGRAEALHLAEAGVDVVITYNTNLAAAEASVADLRAKGVKAAALPLSMNQVAGFPAFVQALTAVLAGLGHDRLDYLVNNAGDGGYALAADTTEAMFDRLYAVHLKAPFFLTQALAALLRDGGRVVNTSSGLARMTMPGSIAYASMKAGVETMTRYYARELGARGISVNVVAPGAIETDFGGGRVRDNAEINKMVAGLTAMGRVGLPDDVGAAVASLLTSKGNWVTGQRIEVSGGQSL